MLRLLDGPCEGVYQCKRAPLYLRAVKDYDDETDVLDLVEDMPKLTEQVYAYKREGEAGVVHLYGRNISGWYATGDYKYLPDVGGEALRDNEAWQTWVAAQIGSIKEVL